jgi:phosphoribosylanthranilate isomerase
MFLDNPTSSAEFERVRVKICGITRLADGLEAVRLGADAIGLVFYEPSPRYVNLTQAKSIVAGLPANVTRVGLFVNADASWITNIINVVGLDLLQFHGDECCHECEIFDRPYMKSISVRPSTNVEAAIDLYPSASGILLDTWQRELRGGSGKSFDWSLVPSVAALPLILAGGLSSHNVASAIDRVRPYAVDVSGGVESAKGIKDGAKMAAFIQQVNSVRLR